MEQTYSITTTDETVKAKIAEHWGSAENFEKHLALYAITTLNAIYDLDITESSFTNL